MFNNRQEDFGDQLPDFSQADENSFLLLYQGIQRGIDEGIIKTTPDFNTLSAAYSLWAIVHGIAVLQVRYLKNFPFKFAAADRRALKALIDGLGPD